MSDKIDMTDAHTFTASALLFDLDGTLVDSAAVSERVWRAWAADVAADADAVLAYSHGRRTLDTTRRFSSSQEAAIASAQWIEAQEIAAEDGTFAIPGPRRC